MCNLPLPMPNIKKLRDNLNSLGFHITAFDFTYKNVTYSVLFEVSDNIKEVSKYYIALLTFVKPNDESLTVAANSLQFNISSITEFRHFFGIEYNNNLHNFLQQFYARFGTFVPECPRENQSKESINQMIHKIAGRFYHDPNAIYCYKVQRNGERNGLQMHRTSYNSSLAFYTRPNLFNYFKNEDTASFYFSTDPQKEKSDSEIISNFSKSESKII